jgi:hypothetical protein
VGPLLEYTLFGQDVDRARIVGKKSSKKVALGVDTVRGSANIHAWI